MSSYEFNLPYPPSQNHIWRTGYKRTYLTENELTQTANSATCTHWFSIVVKFGQTTPRNWRKS